VKRVRECGSLMDIATRFHSRSVRSIENIAAVAESVKDNPSTSTRLRWWELKISHTSIQRILTKGLALTPYDHPMRFRLAQWAEERLMDDCRTKARD